MIYQKNRGVSSARNIGLRLAQGEYVIWIDPDDTLDKDLNLEIVYRLAKQCNALIVKGQFDSYNQETPNIRYKNKPANAVVNNSNSCLQPLIQFYENTLKTGWFTQIGCFMIERAFLEKNQLHFEESLAVAEDSLFNIDLFSCEENISETGHYFINYRQHAQSSMAIMSSNTHVKWIDSAINVTNQIKKRINLAENISLKRLLELTLAIEYYNLHQAINSAPAELRKEYSYLITPELIEFYQSRGLTITPKERR